MNIGLKSFFHIDTLDDPHLLTRLVGLVVRKGGKIERMTCEPMANQKQRLRLSVLGCRPEFLQNQLKKIEGVERVEIHCADRDLALETALQIKQFGG